ncbi:ImmA/IrrE family metallo-endopeptidase [Leptospira bandrabouensis]|uniref:ImmA/IrrE family metallo-endopeptidase n=1 Tax=Leptospira bandrabouensis TaxID=2484903 RepID=UPI00223DBDC7|nr:ImmA/IrrE family metallo-endopeptidase [Leptospira bandrabouensis]MCW7458567.1 ImmA/IrrE family metallo-endopeptidase [Leptospira bandrabouensis]MCW7478686.1 ImmA/IrrE family metallo-endopeptidase [Leptospira bandrabouensis]MCW7486650.1 ImmA/IrrE family metallo-endopeptidase [Leptospira bandrabouensis]
MNRNSVSIQPNLITWARERARFSIETLSKRFPKLPEWESGELQPTLRQLEDFSKAVHVPIGYLFLPEPIQEPLPISDFRTIADQELTKPSPNLLDTLYLCQERQTWYKDYMTLHRLPTVPFVGSAKLQENPKSVARKVESYLGISFEGRRIFSNWSEALKTYVQKMEEAGVLVMASSIVGSNTHRHLDVEEFRGFALADSYAPLIFINTSDSKAAQMFTLLHEFAHLLLGESGISNAGVGQVADKEVEQWCNAVSAEFLMPMERTLSEYREDEPIEDAIQRFAKLFKVSSLVALRRLLDAGKISQKDFWMHYQEELKRISNIQKSGEAGGDFYRTLGVRVGKRFATAVVTSTLEGQTLFRDAFRMLGFKKNETFYKEARELGVMA